MTSEEMLDEYLETGRVEMAGIREQIIHRRLFPCFSVLRLSLRAWRNS